MFFCWVVQNLQIAWHTIVPVDAFKASKSSRIRFSDCGNGSVRCSTSRKIVDTLKYTDFFSLGHSNSPTWPDRFVQIKWQRLLGNL